MSYDEHERHPLESAQAGSDWIDALLALFRTVAETREKGVELPLPIDRAYEQAELARRKL